MPSTRLRMPPFQTKKPQEYFNGPERKLLQNSPDKISEYSFFNPLWDEKNPVNHSRKSTFLSCPTEHSVHRSRYAGVTFAQGVNSHLGFLHLFSRQENRSHMTTDHQAAVQRWGEKKKKTLVLNWCTEVIKLMESQKPVIIASGYPLSFVSNRRQRLRLVPAPVPRLSVGWRFQQDARFQ